MCASSSRPRRRRLDESAAAHILTAVTTRPIALTIAGSDSGGGAGIQADLKTFAMLGCFGTSALTAITAQNTHGVQGVIMLEPDFIVRQIDSIATDLRPAASKTGMVGSAAGVAAVAESIRRHRLSPLVVDPVMIAKGGQRLVDDEAIDAIVRHLLPLAAIVTPNRYEAERLVGFAVDGVDAAARAAETICTRFGAAACVVKTIRDQRDGRVVSVDLLYLGNGEHAELVSPWHEPPDCNTHGSGCTFSAALTAELARGLPLSKALDAAKDFANRAIGSPVRLGTGKVSPVDHLAGRA